MAVIFCLYLAYMAAIFCKLKDFEINCMTKILLFFKSMTKLQL